MEYDHCPICAKPVAGRVSLAGHLEYGHKVADPDAHIAALETERAPTRLAAIIGQAKRAAVVTVGGLVLVAAGLFAYGRLDIGSDGSVALGSGAVEGESSAGAAATVPETTAPPSTSPVDQVPTTTPPPLETTTIVDAGPTSAAPSPDLEFRKPFANGGTVVDCSTDGETATYDFNVSFSGSLNITFGGNFYPERTGDGSRPGSFSTTAGQSQYLDQVEVYDPAGELHEVSINPPIYLSGC